MRSCGGSTFIDLGNEAFLNPVMSDAATADIRSRIAEATARILYRFRHPDFLAGVPRSAKCRCLGCFSPQAYGGLCAEHGRTRLAAEMRKPVLRGFLGDSRKMQAFSTWMSSAHPEGMQLFALWRIASDYRSTSAPPLRVLAARRFLHRHDAAASHGDDEESRPAAVVPRAARPSTVLDRRVCLGQLSEDMLGKVRTAVDAATMLPAELLRECENELFDRLDVLFQREFVETKEYRAVIARISDMIETPRSRR